jgi:hypothetical protein
MVYNTPRLPAAPESVKSAAFKCAWAMSGESEILELTPQFHTFLRTRPRSFARAASGPRRRAPPQDLGTFPGGTTSFATAINNLGQVVDTSTGQP